MSIITVGWSGTWTSIDEATRNDSDFIESHTIPLESTTGEVVIATFEAGLSNISDPASSIEHILNHTYKKNLADGKTIDLTVELIENVTTRATRSYTNIGSAWVEANETLTATEIDSLSDYNDLRIKWTFTASGTGAARKGRVSWANLQAPT